MDINWIEVVSIVSAALAVAFGALGPALGEGRAVASAMDALARQPKPRQRFRAPCSSVWP